MSTKKAWGRLCQKYSPSKKTNLSPIKHVCYNSVVVKDLVKDPFTKPHIWALLNTEEFYYQTTCMVVFHEFEDHVKLSRLLRDTRIKIKWKERLKELVIIGQGTFGDVYKGKDEMTDKWYALKRIVQRKDINSYAESFIKNILLEKNTLSELNKSEFFVRLVGAFQDDDGGAYWFVMEYCICDLRKLASAYPSYGDSKYLASEYLKGGLMENVHKVLSITFKINYKDLIFMYLFEMLCALHYMATKHVKHADLKMDNVLISTTGHIKMADFGLAFADNWFYRNSVKLLVTDQDKKDYVDEMDEAGLAKGNPLHHDAEMVLEAIIKKHPKKIKEIKDFYSDSPYLLRLNSLRQVFLTDIYAVGFITVQLLFGGLNVKIRPDRFRDYTTISWSIDITYDAEVHESFIVQPFLSSSRDRRVTSVMKFLASFFRPREIRIKGFRTTTNIIQNGMIKEEKIVEMGAVEKILYYKTLSMRKMNVLSRILPQAYLEALADIARDSAKDMEPYEDEDKRKVLNIPGFGFTDTDYLT